MLLPGKGEETGPKRAAEIEPTKDANLLLKYS